MKSRKPFTVVIGDVLGLFFLFCFIFLLKVRPGVTFGSLVGEWTQCSGVVIGPSSFCSMDINELAILHCILRRLLGQRRDGLDATTAPGAGPAGSVEQEAADLPLQAGSHLTPLTAPHDSRVYAGRPCPGGAGDLASPAGAAGRLPGNGPSGNAAVSVEHHYLAGSHRQLALSEQMGVDEPEEQQAAE